MRIWIYGIDERRASSDTPAVYFSCGPEKERSIFTKGIVKLNENFANVFAQLDLFSVFVRYVLASSSKGPCLYEDIYPFLLVMYPLCCTFSIFLLMFAWYYAVLIQAVHTFRLRFSLLVETHVPKSVLEEFRAKRGSLLVSHYYFSLYSIDHAAIDWLVGDYPSYARGFGISTPWRGSPTWSGSIRTSEDCAKWDLHEAVTPRRNSFDFAIYSV